MKWAWTLALRAPTGRKWQSFVVISSYEDRGDSTTRMNSRAFPGAPFLFNSAGEATEYALQYGRTLIAGRSPELPVS